MSKVISLRLKESQVEQIGRLARRAGWTASHTAAVLLEEALRMSEHPHIVFRDSAVGRQAYLSGSRLTVWMTVWIARGYDNDLAKTAEHLSQPESMIQAALNYAADYPDEIEEAIAENDAYDFEALKRDFPNARLIEVPDDFTPERDAQVGA